MVVLAQAVSSDAGGPDLYFLPTLPNLIQLDFCISPPHKSSSGGATQNICGGSALAGDLYSISGITRNGCETHRLSALGYALTLGKERRTTTLHFLELINSPTPFPSLTLLPYLYALQFTQTDVQGISGAIFFGNWVRNAIVLKSCKFQTISLSFSQFQRACLCQVVRPFLLINELCNELGIQIFALQNRATSKELFRLPRTLSISAVSKPHEVPIFIFEKRPEFKGLKTKLLS